MCSEIELKKIIKAVVDAYYQAFGDAIDQILLYGSYSRKNNTEDSDIDLVAIVHGERLDLQEKLKKVWDISADLELEYGTIISPAVIPYDEYMKYQDDIPYYRNIKKEGVNVVA